MQFDKINAIVLTSYHKKNYYLLNLFYSKGIINTIIYGSTIRKFKSNINNLVKANFEIVKENNLCKILEVDDEEFILKDLTYEKLVIVHLWTKLISLSFDDGECFVLFTEATDVLNDSSVEKANLVDLQYKIRFLGIKGFLCLSDSCFTCGKRIENLYYYDMHTNGFNCINCTSNKNHYIDSESFKYLEFTIQENIKSSLLIDITNKSKALIEFMIKNKINTEFEQALL
ncbi:DNA repair protein RecO C-terminal domain-containing protein [Borrelia sp. RT5S]|uniref:DNA repair protein RecO C-terminal domain-containing protein n=1 Tax=Borrelia sp. RT5S TaxID=2898581 RepID=UPI001E38C202|nr:DNA repair protein RecO C-terminal domain-containing protein [Borrelia sp. RT5S]UGQ15950.1 DNA repair protein RecO C-terminal domain-containing protein [Borrelia sp. RT5S]